MIIKTAIRQGSYIIDVGGLDLSKIVEHLKYVPTNGEAVYAVHTLSSGRIAIPRYKNKNIVIKDAVIKESICFGTTGQYLCWNADKELRPAQEPGVTSIVSALKTYLGCTMHGKTGSGKTVMALRSMYLLQPKRTVVLVDQLDIAEQWATRIQEYLPNTKIRFLAPEATKSQLNKTVASDQTSEGTVLIVSAQSLYRSERLSAESPLVCDMLVCDEAHVFSAPTFLAAMFKINFHISLALTATPDRKDNLQNLFLHMLGDKVIEVAGDTMLPTIVRMSAPNAGINSSDWNMVWCRIPKETTWKVKCQSFCEHHLKFPLCVGSPKKPNVPKLNRSGMVAALSNSPEFIAWALSIIERLIAKNRKIFVFAEGREILETLCEKITASRGEIAGVFLGKGTKTKTDQTRQQRGNSLKLQVTFVTFGVAKKALDVAEKDCALFLTPPADPRQPVGRIMRTYPGKPNPVAIVAVPEIPTFFHTWRKLKACAKSMGWPIKE